MMQEQIEKRKSEIAVVLDDAKWNDVMESFVCSVSVPNSQIDGEDAYESASAEIMERLTKGLPGWEIAWYGSGNTADGACTEDLTLTPPEILADQEPRHSHDCICADCSGAALTSDND